jgi:NADPH2:quinone reductase
MTMAIVAEKTGGPEVLVWKEVEVPPPGKGEVRLKQTAIGINFIDIYERTGLYDTPTPFIPGREAAGVVEAVGPGVKGAKVGDRVAYCAAGPGAYAEARNMVADKLIRIPRDISDRHAASIIFKGLTAWFLVRRTHKVAKGDTVLIHAAAGGVGLILTQWARKLGATVIGTVGTDEKAKLIKRRGAHHAIVYTREDFVKRVAEITKGKKCDVVYDSVGAATFPGSLDCLRPRGLFVTFGNASGPVPAFAPLLLAQKGSLFMTRPMLYVHIQDPKELAAGARELWTLVRSGALKVEAGQTYALKDATQAHIDLAARKTTGPSLLIP